MENSNLASGIAAELKREVLYRLYDECLVRIHICLDKLTDEQVWWRPNNESNSIGNLVLHLAGNVRQWVNAGIAGESDLRTRDEEFAATGEMRIDELRDVLNGAMEGIKPVIDSVAAENLLEKRPVQVYHESVLTILVHITEHFSYHTGQIAWITKMLTGKQVGFYEGQDLG